MSDRYLVKRLDLRHWGSTISGPSGRVYFANPESGLLHLTEGKKFSRTAGCLLVDAEEFKQFEGFQVGELPKAKKVPPPRRPSAPPPSAPPEDEVPANTDPVTTESGGALPEDIPGDEEAKSNWIDWALENGIELTSAERKLKKARVLVIIKDRAREE